MDPKTQILQKYGLGGATPKPQAMQTAATPMPQQPQNQSVASTIGKTAFGATRNISDLLNKLSLGQIPQTGAAVYEAGRAGAQALGVKNAFQANADPFLTDPQLSQYTSPQKGAIQTGRNIAGSEAWALGGFNPGLNAAGRFGIGATSGLLQNVAQGQEKNIPSDIISALAGGTLNAVVPPATEYVGKQLAKIPFGRAGASIPDIVKETGQKITGIGTPEAKAAASDIGEKIGNLYDQMGTGMTRDEVFNILNDTPALDPTGNVLPTNLDYFMREAGIPAENKSQVLQFIKTMAVGAGMRKSLQARASQAESGAITKEFNSALNQYLADNPDVAEQITKGGIDTAQIPGGFWHDFTQNIEPNQKVFDQIAHNPDYEPTVEDRVRIALGSKIRDSLQGKLSEQSPNALSELKRLNQLYGVAKPISTGNIKDAFRLGGYHKIMGAVGLGALGASALNPKVGGTNLSPYLQGLAALSILTNPGVMGRAVSATASPMPNAIMNALTSLLGQKAAVKLTQ